MLRMRGHRSAAAVRATVVALAVGVAAPVAAIATPVPNTFIDSGPPTVTNSPAATVTFHSDDPAATFECRHDTTSFVACASPRTVANNLPEGDHAFYVRAVNSSGADPTPATATWTTDYTPPSTAVSSHPPALTNARTASFEFGSPDASASFECALDGARPSSCRSPLTLGGLGDGTHTMLIRAVDPAGNVDPGATPITWSVDTAPPQTTVTPTAPPRDQSTVTFHLTASEPGSTFQCRRDGESFRSCAATIDIGPLKNGTHSFQARATDPAGNTDRSPATISWRVAVPPGLAAMNAAFDKVYAAYRSDLPVGLCVGAIDNGTSATKCYGGVAPGSTVHPDHNTLFEIASLTKTFTATLLAVNVKERKVRLGAAVHNFIPATDGAVNYRPNVTLLDLIQHYAGLPEGYDRIRPIANVDDLFVHAGECYVTAGCPGILLPPDHKHFGFVYSNVGYGVLGQILGLRDGFNSMPFSEQGGTAFLPPWEQALDASVINPLGMTVTKTFQGYAASNFDYYSAHAATGLTKDGTNWDPLSIYGAPATDPAGGLWSSPADMMKWLAYSMRGDAPGVLGRAFPLLYRTPDLFRTAGALGDDIGLGWFLNHGHGYTTISKVGGYPGFQSVIAFVEHQHRGAFVLINSPPGAYETKMECKLLRALPPRNPSLPCERGG
jgi:CubicO group peptidase (beta-lactamase class C family)